MASLSLILKDIVDVHVRQNFFRIQQFVNTQVLFQSDFKFFEVVISNPDTNFKVLHGLSFIPIDIIELSVQGDYNFYFKYSDFDKNYIYINASGACTLRFMAGRMNRSA